MEPQRRLCWSCPNRFGLIYRSNLRTSSTCSADRSPTEQLGETRPITLSSVLLKTFSQLLLRRVGDIIQTPARLQWCRRGRQGIELIMILRRIARIAPRLGPGNMHCETGHSQGLRLDLPREPRPACLRNGGGASSTP